MLRVATLDKEHCKPDDCGIPCYRFCPEVLNRRYAIKFVAGEKKPIVDEDLCTGCGICIKKTNRRVPGNSTMRRPPNGLLQV